MANVTLHIKLKTRWYFEPLIYITIPFVFCIMGFTPSKWHDVILYKWATMITKLCTKAKAEVWLSVDPP